MKDNSEDQKREDAGAERSARVDWIGVAIFVVFLATFIFALRGR
jgi:hypothetical protein